MCLCPNARDPDRDPMTQVSAVDWWEGGETLELKIGGGARILFIRQEGEGPWLTPLHGYPASSLEWAEMWPLPAASHHLLAFNFLGFGASDKPASYDYPLDDQVHAVEAIWDLLEATSSALVAYDYGAIVAQILQARRAPITAIAYLNASLYPEPYRPRIIQRLSRAPLLGPLLWSRFDLASFRHS
jgi:pimeloyl-ACP methyl ester carboxylesterase